MRSSGGARLVGQVTASAVGLVLAACALSAVVSTTALPHPVPQQPAAPVHVLGGAAAATPARAIRAIAP